MVQAYGARERIGSLHLDTKEPDQEDILNIPVEAYLPTEEDTVRLRSEFRREISQVISRHLDFLGPSDDDNATEPRPFLEESSQKSTIVSCAFQLDD